MKVVRCISVDAEVISKIGRLAKERGMKLSTLIEEILKAYLTEIEKHDVDKKSDEFPDAEHPVLVKNSKVKIEEVKDEYVIPVKVSSQALAEDRIIVFKCPLCGEYITGNVRTQLTRKIERHYYRKHNMDVKVKIITVDNTEGEK